jgi:hypothetical protein
VRAFTDRDAAGKVTHVSSTVHGDKKDAQRLAAELTARGQAHTGGRTVADLLDEWGYAVTVYG